MQSKSRGDGKRIAFVDVAVHHAGIAKEITDALGRAVARADFILGEDVTRFEGDFAQFCGVEFAVGVDSGTSALELALRAHGIGLGDEVITAANTFIATVLAISYVGATPVLVDVDPRTCNLDVSRIERSITPRTRAVMPVHLYGQPADMDPILEIARCYKLTVVEDACQAHGARYKGRRAGALGHSAAFSFYPAKNLGALGDGGMFVTHDKDAAQSVRMLRNYGEREKYHHLLRGFNRRLDTIQAAVLRAKLKHLNDWNAARRRHAAAYRQLLADSQVTLLLDAPDVESVYHLFVIRVGNRDELRSRLADEGISTGIHYPIPIHMQPAYQSLGHSQGDFPATEALASQILSLPMYPEIKEDEIARVCEVVRTFARPCVDGAMRGRQAGHGGALP